VGKVAFRGDRGRKNPVLSKDAPRRPVATSSQPGRQIIEILVADASGKRCLRFDRSVWNCQPLRWRELDAAFRAKAHYFRWILNSWIVSGILPFPLVCSHHPRNETRQLSELCSYICRIQIWIQIGNYDGNDGFFDASDWKQSKKEYFILLYRIQCLNTSCLISLTDLADSQLAVHSSAIFTVRSSWYDSHILRFFKSNSLARDLLNFKTVHIIAQKQPPKVVSANHRIFLSNPD